MTPKAAIVQIHGYIELILAIFHRMFDIAACEGDPGAPRDLRGRLGWVDHDRVREGLIWVMMRVHRNCRLALSCNLLLDTGLLQAPSSHCRHCHFTPSTNSLYAIVTRVLLGRHHQARRTDHLRMAFPHLSESAIIRIFLTLRYHLFRNLLPDDKRLAELGVGVAPRAEIALLELGGVGRFLGTEWTLR